MIDKLAPAAGGDKRQIKLTCTLPRSRNNVVMNNTPELSPVISLPLIGIRTCLYSLYRREPARGAVYSDDSY